MNLDSYLESRTDLINARLSELVPLQPKAPQALLFESARYILLNPGKRLRPILTLAAVESLGGTIESALTPACAIEILHTYSLVHDDLPCMDDDDLRRGMPTLHTVYPEGHAVLTGDFLLTYAFEVLSQSPFLDSEQRLQLVQVLSQRAGAHGMIGGQVVDIASEGKPISWELLHFIHHHKTAALVSACLEFAGIIAKASESDRELLKSIGLQIGLSFQLIDDVLDVTGTQELIGKPLFSDKDNEKATSVSVLGLEKAQTYAQELYVSALSDCKKLSFSSPLLEGLLSKLVHRSK
jgi:geranylgeranyl diphosphate synthase, type II